MTTPTTESDPTGRIAQVLREDPELEAFRPDPDVTARAEQDGVRLPQLVTTILAGYADRPALGRRVHATDTDPATGRTVAAPRAELETISYRELGDDVAAVTADWYHHGEHPLRAGDVVATLGFTSTDYATLELATVRSGAVLAPLQSSASLGQLNPILAETEARLLAASAELLDTAVECALAGDTLRRLVVFDHHPEVDDHREALEQARRRLADAGSPVVVDTLDDVRSRGRTLPAAPRFEPADDDDPLTMLIYTSGSTGTPKGAMYPESIVRGLWGRVWPTSRDLPVVGFNYMPMSHLAGQVSLITTLARGGVAYFTAHSDLSTLFADLALARPTEIMFVPRICDMLRQEHQRLISRGQDDAAARTAIRDDVLGGRLLYANCGSAPLSDEMHAFVEACLDIPLHIGYGSTEDGVVLHDGKVQRPPVTDYKLVDVPELGYYTTDAPHPRGELLVRTATLIPGYYKRPDATAEVFDDEGFYATGDVVAELEPDRLRYVDRRKNVLKLAQGEFVAVARLEAIFVESPLVRQIFVYGSGERSYLLAVVVPTDDALARAGEADELRPELLAELQRVGREDQLATYEVPRDVLVETEPFSNANGMLSDARKLLRPRLSERYGERLEALYARAAQARDDEWATLRREGRDLPAEQLVLRAAAAVLEVSADDLDLDAHFTDLGGDSLSALSLSSLLGEMLETEVPVGTIISPANDLRTLAATVAGGRLGGDGTRPTFASVHGADATEVHASDFDLADFVDAATLDGARDLPAPEATPRTVLLTGANGYLGRFLALEWLERLAPRDGRLVCVVRGTDDAGARRRLDDAVSSGDPALDERYTELAAEHLEVLAGDIGAPNLGLDDSTWRRLADEVDLVVHPAALVNHVLPYRQLFEPNVVGTAEIIRLALTGRRKPVTYLSTVGVIAGTDVAEDADIRTALPAWSLDASAYASGYATSKWAGEVLLAEAHDRCGLPVTVFRSDMILAHRRWIGQINVTDVFTRLLLSLIATGLAPGSFYVRSGGERPRAHYDGLPGDFTAAAVTTLGEQNKDGHASFNVLNPHADGISLDTVVDWLIDDGLPITRIEDHAEWVERFTTALRALPEARRAASVLPLLDAFSHPEPPVDGSSLPAARFADAVREAGFGHQEGDGGIPHVTHGLISKYVDDLRALELL